MERKDNWYRWFETPEGGDANENGSGAVGATQGKASPWEVKNGESPAATFFW